MSKLHNDVKIFDIELIVVYKYGEDLIQLSQSNEGMLKFAILDKDKDPRTSETSIEFENSGVIKGILKDFNKKYKQFKIDAEPAE